MEFDFECLRAWFIINNECEPESLIEMFADDLVKEKVIEYDWHDNTLVREFMP